jgi:hypothetical protein
MSVLSLRRPAEGVQLLRWNKKLPSASTQDPLGLNLRLSARLTRASEDSAAQSKILKDALVGDLERIAGESSFVWNS